MDDVVYTLRDFRSKTKEAFDRAESMIDVVIMRKDVKFVLMTDSYYQELLKDEKIPEKKFDLNRIAKEVEVHQHEKLLEKVVENKPNWQPCKHGADPRFCKHAKFVNGKKVCK